jgi:hypothetical protein
MAFMRHLRAVIGMEKRGVATKGKSKLGSVLSFPSRRG